MRDFFVMRSDPVHNRSRLIETPEEIGSHLSVRPLDLMGHGLADVVKQARSLGCLDVLSQFRSHQTAEMSHLQGMLEDVLRVAVPEMQPTQHFGHLRMDRRLASLVDRVLALAEDKVIHLNCDCSDHLLDTGRVDAAVEDQSFHGLPRHFAPDWIKTGEHHRIGRVIHQHRDARGVLERTDVAPVAANDPTLHFFGRQGHGGRAGLVGVLTGVALDGRGDNAPSLLLGTVLRVFEDVSTEVGGITGRILFDLLQQQRSGLEGAETRQRLQLTLALLRQPPDLETILVQLRSSHIEGLRPQACVVLLRNQSLHLTSYRRLPLGQAGFCAPQT